MITDSETKAYEYECHDMEYGEETYCCAEPQYMRKTSRFRKLIPFLVMALFLAVGSRLFYAQWKKQNQAALAALTRAAVVQEQARINPVHAPLAEKAADKAQVAKKNKPDPAVQEPVMSVEAAKVEEPEIQNTFKENSLATESESAAAEEQESALPELQALNDEYQKLCAEVEAVYLKNLEKLGQAYIKCLAEREKQLQIKGDLHGMLAFQRERERFEKDGEFPSIIDQHVTPALRAAQGRAIGYLEKVQTAKIEKFEQLRQKHLARLTALEKELTTKRRIEDAILVRGEKERIEFEGQIMASISMTSGDIHPF